MDRSIGVWISKNRQAKGWNQQSLAVAIGSQSSSVSRWERDECLPDLENFRALCEAFGASADEALGLNGQRRKAS